MIAACAAATAASAAAATTAATASSAATASPRCLLLQRRLLRQRFLGPGRAGLGQTLRDTLAPATPTGGLLLVRIRALPASITHRSQVGTSAPERGLAAKIGLVRQPDPRR